MKLLFETHLKKLIGLLGIIRYPSLVSLSITILPIFPLFLEECTIFLRVYFKPSFHFPTLMKWGKKHLKFLFLLTKLMKIH